MRRESYSRLHPPPNLNVDKVECKVPSWASHQKTTTLKFGVGGEADRARISKTCNNTSDIDLSPQKLHPLQLFKLPYNDQSWRSELLSYMRKSIPTALSRGSWLVARDMITLESQTHIRNVVDVGKT